jgi:hypothetical protein
MPAAEHSTFWLLYGQYGPTMSIEKFREEFMPKLTMKTLQNWIARGDAPRPVNGILDVRDVAEWWDNQRCGIR